MAITPDTKDWTWVLCRRCEQCGVEAALSSPSTVPGEVEEAIGRWRAVLARQDVRRRPDEQTWSPLEYATHVSDVFELFTGRLALVLENDGPTFDDWDQDTAAVTGDYGRATPATVADELALRGERVAHAFQAVPEQQWERTGFRSDGAAFTVHTLAQYMVHDVLHHLHDVDG